MTDISQIRLMNDSMVKYLKKLETSVLRNEMIGKMLKDDACFFKMEKEEAISILKEIGISEENIEQTYEELISKQKYYQENLF